MICTGPAIFEVVAGLVMLDNGPDAAEIGAETPDDCVTGFCCCDVVGGKTICNGFVGEESAAGWVAAVCAGVGATVPAGNGPAVIPGLDGAATIGALVDTGTVPPPDVLSVAPGLRSPPTPDPLDADCDDAIVVAASAIRTLARYTAYLSSSVPPSE